jgi:hypothetical protein
LNYSYDGKYFIEGSLRRDAYSGFGKDYKWGTFPSVSVGWEMTKEDFMKNIRVLDYLKIRGSYGKVGNYRGVGAYDSRALYGGATYTITTGLGNIQAPNASLHWESSNKTDIGLEANFLKGKLGLIVDYFKNDINGLILNAPTLYTVGVPGAAITKNIGGMTNTGIEITINATPVSIKDFKWTTSFNYTHVKNKITGLVAENGNADLQSTQTTFYYARLGYALGIPNMPVWAGVDPATGNPQWYAADGTIKRYNLAAASGTWTDDKGNPVAALGTADNVFQADKPGLPTWYGGWDNTVTYKNFDLSISMMYQGGNYLYNQTRATLLSNSFLNNSTEILNRWTKPGDVTDIAKVWINDNTANQVSTRFLEKGDYLKVRTITLGYTLPKSILTKIGFDGFKVYGQVFNPFTITKYKGADPEVNTNRFDNIGVGYDLRNVPQSRTFTLGIQASF